jgi:hypothetical protein
MAGDRSATRRARRSSAWRAPRQTVEHLADFTVVEFDLYHRAILVSRDRGKISRQMLKVRRTPKVGGDIHPPGS